MMNPISKNIFKRHFNRPQRGHTFIAGNATQHSTPAGSHNNHHPFFPRFKRPNSSLPSPSESLLPTLHANSRKENPFQNATPCAPAPAKQPARAGVNAGRHRITAKAFTLILMAPSPLPTPSLAAGLKKCPSRSLPRH
jgi:hypothetical protein